MYAFLSNGLKCSNFMKPFDIFGLELPKKFSFPFIHIAGEIIILCFDDQTEPNDENVIEITKREFEALFS